MAARYPRCAVLMWLHGVVRRRYVAAMVRREEESRRVCQIMSLFNIPGPYFIKVKIILSFRFKINLIFYLIKEFMKHSCLNFFYGIVNKINIKVKRN